MQIQLTPYHARMIANNVDYNWSGNIERNELQFRRGAKRLVDYDRNGRVSTDELAYSLQRGDIYITGDRKAYPTYGRPGYGFPGGGYNPGYGYPGYINQPPLPQAPGYPYQHRTQVGASSLLKMAAGTAIGSAVGAGAAYAMSAPLATGAAIGGAIGLIANFFIE